MPASGERRRSHRRWGWHPLADEWAARVVSDARVRPGQLVLDVGAGHGVLTGHLVAAGARVLAIELHPGRAQRLRERFAGQPVTVVQADAAHLQLPHRPFRVIANPPFSISTALLRQLLAPGSRLLAADLVLQRAVVRRWADGPARPAGRSLRHYDVRRGRSLPRSAFQPAPHVDAAVLVVRRR